jgi:hypothetical protein
MALTPARRWDVEHGLAPASLHDKHVVARRGSQFLTTAPPTTGETLLWPVELERSPSMGWLWGGEGGPHAAPSGGMEAKVSLPN